MKNVFVLDECVVRCISQSLNEKGEFDTSFGHLFYSIIHNCHKIALTSCLYAKYSRKIDDIEAERDTPRNDLFFHLLSFLMTFQEKIVWGPDTILSFPEGSFDDDDEQMVSLASLKNAILVTVDDKLIRDLTNSRIISTYNFKVKRPELALPYAL